MPNPQIHTRSRSCGSYGPGHQVHWIQAKRGWEQQPVFHVAVKIHSDGHVELKGDGLKLEMWNHDPSGLRDAMDYRGRGWPRERAIWRPQVHLLKSPGGGLFNLATWDQQKPCHPTARRIAAESTAEELVRAMKEDHGFTVAGRSLPHLDGDRNNT
jgi:hypothetical protein